VYKLTYSLTRITYVFNTESRIKFTIIYC